MRNHSVTAWQPDRLALCLACTLLGMMNSATSISHAANVDFRKHPPPEVFIYPTPREATYGKLDIAVSGPDRSRACIVLPSNPSPFLRAAAEDLTSALLRIAPRAKTIPIDEGRPSDNVPTCILLGVAGSHPALDEALHAAKLPVTAVDPGSQGYRISVRQERRRKLVLLAGCDEQGASWACRSFAQLLRADGQGNVRAYSVNVRDWPGFARRMTTVEAVYESKHNGLASMKERMAVVLGLKYNVSCYSGDNAELNPWLKDRGFKAGTGYWTFQNVSRKATELGLKPYNWSDDRILNAWSEEYARNARNLKPGLVIWHDCTDAGWFNKYLDKFWGERDDIDKKNYPDAHPARADAERFNRIYQAVKAASPDSDVYFTVPCYYDQPQNDKLPRIELFRDYLRTLGKLTPKDIVWVLEDRGPADIAAYQQYLGGRCVNYRYPFPTADGMWSTNFTAAKHAVGVSDSYWFCVGHYPNDLMMACAAEYLWNPDTPEDYPHITENLVPRASRFLFGDAWREMAEIIVNVNLVVENLKTAKQVEVVQVGQRKVNRAVELLRTATQKCDSSLPDGRVSIQKLLNQMGGAQKWLGLRLALSEAHEQCQQAEALLVFGQATRSRESLDAAKRLLGRVEESQLREFTWLQEDRKAASEKIAALEQGLQTGDAGQRELNILPLDGQWQFKLDPKDAGGKEKWFKSTFDRSGWAGIGVPGLWEQSNVPGAAPGYDGVAWYARSFTMPPKWKGRKVVLHIGACDDEAWGYVNGAFVGDHKEKDHPQVCWEEAFEFDITKAVKWTSPNLLVIRVNDTHLGGGIWKSVYLRADEPDRPAPGPGDVEIKEGGKPPSLRKPIDPTAGKARTSQRTATSQTRTEVQPGWSTVLASPSKDEQIEITVSLLGHGPDPESSLQRPLADTEKKWFADHRVGRLTITSFMVGDKQLVIQNRYPGHLIAFSYSWDGTWWHYHSLEEVKVTHNALKESVLCKGRSFCADYGRFETWMKYEYEIGVRADGLIHENLTLIPDHDTGFSPHRNGPPYGSTSAGCSVSGLRLALERLPSGFTTALVAPFDKAPARAFDLDYASDKLVWSGRMEGFGCVGAYDSTAGVYFALIAPAGDKSATGSIQQFDAHGYPGDELWINTLRPLVQEWPSGSRNTLKRWIATGKAGDLEAAKQALRRSEASLTPRG